MIGLLTAASLLAGCAVTGTSTSNPATAQQENPLRAAGEMEQARAQAKRTGEVYLLRGLMDIFSRGIDVMAVQMRKQGFYAHDASYADWKKLADDIIAREKKGEVSHPIILIGHSLGANDVATMANYLSENDVKVGAVIAFDPTEPRYLDKNIGTVVNYYIPNKDNKFYKGKGFNGSLVNVDVSDQPDITHITIEKNARLQGKVMNRVLKLTRKRRS